MTPRHLLSLALTAATLLLAAGQAPAQIAYTLFRGNNLFRFDLAAPGTLTDVGPFTGATTAVGMLDFRPADGNLYGYTATGNKIVRIDVATAVTTFVSTPSTAPINTVFGVDFNPVADQLRLVNFNDQNLSINVDPGATTVDGTLAYAAGDAHFGADPLVIEAAYTNSDQDPGTGTTLFYIDFGLDILATTTNPNTGTLNTVGPLGVNTSNFLGFDIFTNGGNNFAYAILSDVRSPSLYSINLNTGAATLIDALDSNSNLLGNNGVFSLAIAPLTVATPEPGSLALLATGVIGAMAWRRRRRR